MILDSDWEVGVGVVKQSPKKDNDTSEKKDDENMEPKEKEKPKDNKKIQMERVIMCRMIF